MKHCCRTDVSQELFGEYRHALRLPGTPIKTFRLRLFLFPAAEEPVTPEDLAFYSHASHSSRWVLLYCKCCWLLLLLLVVLVD